MSTAAVETADTLTGVERTRLAHEEAVIERGLGTFMQVGRALAAIRDQRLYREDHGTFEAYCQTRWGFTDRRARQMIDAATTVDTLPTGTTVPVSERQARELSGLEPEIAADVMRAADEATDGNLTAAAIREAREQVAPRQQVPTGLTRVTETTKSDTYVDTATGEIVPESEPEPRWQPAPPSTESQAARDEQTSREVFSKNLARSVYMLAGYAAVADAPAHAIERWVPSQDIYPEPLTAQRMRDAAVYLHAVADLWETP